MVCTSVYACIMLHVDRRLVDYHALSCGTELRDVDALPSLPALLLFKARSRVKMRTFLRRRWIASWETRPRAALTRG